MVVLIPLHILIPISLVVIILIIVLWYLYTKNKKIAERLISETTRFHRYRKGIEAMKKFPQNPETDFRNLNKYARAFFKEYLNLDYSLTYLELEEYFKKQNKQEHAEFCKLMSDVNYKGERTKEDVQRLVELFSKIMKTP